MERNGRDAPNTIADARNLAARCRALTAGGREGILSTFLGSSGCEAYPYGSLVTFALDEDGQPLFLFSTLAEHTSNLAAQPRASLLVLGPAAPEAKPLDRPRVAILGPCAKVVGEAEVETARRTFLAQRPEAEAFARFADFGVYRLSPERLRLIDGFGQVAWVTGEDYRRAPRGAT